MRSTEFSVRTRQEEEFVDITEEVRRALRSLKADNGICHVFVPHATAAVAINENADPNIGRDILWALDKAVPKHAGYRHDRIDNNAAAHIKASIIGPSESVPVREGDIVLGTWQDIFLCDFDGPRERRIIVTFVGETE
ncbi:YjbQ family protein [Candidatus Woesearchaeota archaeon]|nr:MAG: YjbQ family protein [Candidatus Woesearchaeota archaeon]